MDDILANLVRCHDRDTAQARAENIGANSPDAIRATLAALYRNDPPDPVALSDLGVSLDQLLHPQDDRFSHSTLLTEAVRQQNYVWVVAL